MFKPPLILLLVAAGSATTGCITHEETIYRDTPRVKVEFENVTAAHVFYKTLSERPPRVPKSETRSRVGLPLILSHDKRVITGNDAAFNESVRLCDTNQDQIITETEAAIFAARPKNL